MAGGPPLGKNTGGTEDRGWVRPKGRDLGAGLGYVAQIGTSPVGRRCEQGLESR